MKSLSQLFTFFIIIITSSNLAGQDTINWRADYKLKWEDFQGTPDSSLDYKAISSPAIKYYLSNTDSNFTITIFCFFKKTKSWVSIKDSTLLEHEQGHFDIAEVFTRKFRKRIKEYKFNHRTVSLDIEKIFKEIIEERAHFDLLYDKETNYSRNKIKQHYWNKRIKEYLNRFKNYEKMNNLPKFTENKNTPP
ncbi:MAG: hypothetical protein KA821_11080 [Chitinophagaceae bacterium]|nr:hypothetical protein [Chitinophagaceae bacterium]